MCEYMIREQGAKDIGAILHLAEQLHYMHNSEQFDSKWKLKWLRTFVNQKGNILVVAFADGPVGYLLGERRIEEYSRQYFLYVREIFVKETNWKKGCGTELIDYCKDRAVSLGCKYISLNVRLGNPNKDFFHKCGFKHFSSEMKLSL
jgi:GNAT superfamily N-acetyltransferase